MFKGHAGVPLRHRPMLFKVGEKWFFCQDVALAKYGLEIERVTLAHRRNTFLPRSSHLHSVTDKPRYFLRADEVTDGREV